MVFLLFLLILPLIEIALFAAVGEEVGVFNTVFLCIASAGFGVFLVQSQGLKTMESMQKSMDGGILPVDEMFRGVCLFVAGMLLILPGFFTDGVAILLLIPPVQHLLRSMIARYFTGEPVSFRAQGWRSKSRNENADIVDVEYTHVETDNYEAGTRIDDQRDKP